MGKTDIRNRSIELRSDLSASALRRKNLAIMARLKSTIDWEHVRSVHTYRSVEAWHEVDTAWLADYLTETWPDIRLSVGNPDRTLPLPVEPFDIILVPLLAFDDHLNRLGFGGGWYDRFLVGQDGALKVGLAYDVQQADSLPTHQHDIPMDMIITETRTLTK